MTISPSEHPGPLNGRSVLVIGGRGFIGSHIVRHLVAHGARPAVFGPQMDENRLADLAGKFNEFEGSVESRESLDRALRESAAEAVVSCAAHGVGRLGLMRSGEAEADRALAINVGGLNRSLEAARAARVRRFVWTSSTVVYGPSGDYPIEPVDETAALRPMTFYGLTKALAEEVASFHARRHGLSVVGLRLPLILGPGLWYQGAAAALSAVFEAARTGGPCRLSFHAMPIDLMHVSDVASAVLRVLMHGGPLRTVYNLEGFKARASDIVAEIRRLRPGLHVEYTSAEPAALFPLVSGARLRADAGFEARYDLPRLVEDMLQGGEPAHDR